jgi:hypothetical protein
MAVIRQSGRDRSGRDPQAKRPTFFTNGMAEGRGSSPYDPDSAETTMPVTEPYMSNTVLNATADYHVDDIARGGASGH